MYVSVVNIDQWFLNGFNPDVHNCNDAVCRRIKRENWFRHQLPFRRIGRADGVWFSRSGTPEQFFWGKLTRLKHKLGRSFGLQDLQKILAMVKFRYCEETRNLKKKNFS